MTDGENIFYNYNNYNRVVHCIEAVIPSDDCSLLLRAVYWTDEVKFIWLVHVVDYLVPSAMLPQRTDVTPESQSRLVLC